MSVFRENTDQDLEECLNILCDCIEAVKHSLQKERSFFDARLAKLTRELARAKEEIQHLKQQRTP